MRKFIFRFTLLLGIVLGITYWKKDEILDFLINYSVDVDKLDKAVDNCINKAVDVKDEVLQTKKALNESQPVFSALTNDISHYSDEIKPIINNIKKDINKLS